MTSLERGWQNGPALPLFHEQGNSFGGLPFTSSAVSGPVFDPHGKQLRAMNPAEGFAEFFGMPKKKLERPASDDLELELYNLPAAYKGKNSYLSQILIAHITEDDTWILRDFAPWTRHEESLQVAWDVWSFMDHQLGRTPEEAVSRLLSSKVSAESTTMVRYGIALMLEHGFFNSPKGRKHYAMNIKQIQNAIVETAAFGAMHHALNADVWVDGYEIYRDNSRGRNKSGLDAFFANELDTWAMLQKSEDGFVNMISMMEEALAQRNGVNPDIVCLPKGTRKYMQNITMGKPYAESGLKVGERKDLISSALNGSGLRYYESRYFRQNEHRAAIDPAYQERTIGTFFQVNSNCLRNIDASEFRISMLDTVIYNEDSDGMEVFSYRENFRYFGLFDRFDTTEFAPQSVLGKKYFAGHNSWWDFMQTTSPHDAQYTVKGIAGKTPAVQAKFVHAMLGNAQDQAAHSHSTHNARRPPPINPITGTTTSSSTHGRFHGSGASGTREEEKQAPAVSAQRLSQQFQAEFKLSASEARQVAQFLAHLEELDARGRGSCNLLSKTQAIANKKRSVLNGANLYATLEFELAGDLLCYDLNRAVMDVRGGALDITPTPLEETFDGFWPSKPTSEMQAADERSAYWLQLHNKKARLPISVYHAPDHVKQLPLHSEVFTLTSSSLALLRLSPKVLADLTQQLGTIAVEFNSETLKQSDLIRAGLLQFSVAISGVFEILKAALPLYRAANDTAGRQRVFAETLQNVTNVAATLHPITGDEEHYRECIEIARGLPVLECQQSMASMIATLTTIVRARFNQQLDNESFAAAAHSFWQQYTVFHSNANPSRAGQASSSGMMRPRSITTNVASFLLNNAGHSTDSFYEEALGRTRALHKKLVQESKLDSDSDSFLVYHDSYVEMYQVVKAKGWDLKIWQELVRKCQAKYTGPNGLDTVASTLEVIFAYFNDASGSTLDINAIIADDAEAKKQTTERSKRLSELKDAFKGVLDYHNKYHVDLFADLPGTLTTQRQARRLVLEGKSRVLLPDPMDQIVAILYKSANTSTADAVAYLSDQANTSALTGSVDLRPHILLEWLCLKSDNLSSIDSALRGNQSDLANSVVVGILRNGSVVDHWKQIRLKWGLAAPKDKNSATAALDSAQYAQAQQDLQPLSERQIIELLKTPGINGAYIHFCIENDVLPPIGGEGDRPHMTYEMGTAWMAQGGGKCASTLFGHADFQLADDAARKIHYGHFTMYNKTVIWSRQHIVHARNVFCRDYKGGNGTSVWDPLNPDDVDAYITNNLKYDIFWIPKPIGHYTSSKHQSITGCYPKELQASKEVNEASQSYRREVFVKHWRWQNQEKRDPLTPTIYQDAKHNIIVFQAHQGVYNHATKFPDRIITEKGHWGPNVYATCGKTRKGGQTHKTLLHVNHNGTNTIQLVKN